MQTALARLQMQVATPLECLAPALRNHCREISLVGQLIGAETYVAVYAVHTILGIYPFERIVIFSHPIDKPLYIVKPQCPQLIKLGFVLVKPFTIVVPRQPLQVVEQLSHIIILHCKNAFFSFHKLTENLWKNLQNSAD